jgi:hypothetical protein
VNPLVAVVRRIKLQTGVDRENSGQNSVVGGGQSVVQFWRTMMPCCGIVKSEL